MGAELQTLLTAVEPLQPRLDVREPHAFPRGAAITALDARTIVANLELQGMTAGC
jgi:hypothetical protein